MAYLPPFNGGRINASIGGNSTSAGAGYALMSSGTMLLAGGNNITLSQNGNTVTVSGANQTVQTQNLHNLTLSGNTAGAMAQVSSGTLTLAGGNNITLSQAGNAITISGGPAGGIALANSQTTYTSGTANLSVVGGAMTIASTTGQSFNFSVPQVSSLSATGAISISTNGNTISIGAPAMFDAGISNIGNTSGTSGQNTNGLVLAGGNNITLSQSTNSNGATITVSGPNQSVQTQNLIDVTIGGNSTSAGGGYALVSSGTLTLAGGNNITLSQNGNAVTISAPNAVAQTNQTVGLYGLGNTTQNSSTTLDARSLSFNGLGAVTVGYSNGSIQISAPTQTVQTQNLMTVNGTQGNVSISGGANVTVGNNASTITISAAAQTNQTVGLYGLGNTTQNSSTTLDARTLSFNGLGGATVGYSNGSIQISGAQTVAQTNQSVGLYALGNTTQNSSTTLDARSLSFNGIGAASVGYSNGSIQLSVPTQTVQTQNLIDVTLAGNSTSAGGGYALASSGTLTLAGGNNITLSQNGNAVTIVGGAGGGGGVALANSQTTYTSGTANFVEGGGAITIASTTGQSFNISVPSLSTLYGINGNIVSTSGGSISISAPSNTFGIGGTSLTGAGMQVYFAGINNITLAQSTNGSSATISISGPFITNQNISMYAVGNTTSASSSSVINAANLSFNGAGGLSVGYSNGSVMLSSPVIPAAGLYALGNTTQNSSTTLDIRSLSFNGLGAATMGYSSGSIQVSVPIQSVASITLAAYGNTMPGYNTSFNGYAGGLIYAGTGNVSVGFNAGSLMISGSQSVQTQNLHNLTLAGNTTGTLAQISSGTLTLAGGNNITLSQNGNAVTISGGAGINIAASNTTFSSGNVVMSNNGGALTIGSGAQSVLFSVPQTSSLSATGAVSISTNGSTISIGAPAAKTYNSTVFGKRNNWGTGSISLSQASIYIFPEVLDQYVSGSIIKIPVFITNSSSAFGAHTRGHTVNFGIYSRNATNSTVLTQMYSTSYTAAMSGSTNSTWGLSIITGLGNATSYNSLTASSASSALSASIHGSREFLVAFATNMAPGEYWFAIHNSSSSAGAAGNLFQLSYPVISATNITGNALGVSQGTSSAGLMQNIGYGVYSTTTAALPSGISMTQINQSALNPILYFMNATS